jgi:mannose-6-phosphate isomerase
MNPVQLAPNLVDHFYAGGGKIASLRGIETTSDHQPEEWIAATVARADAWPIGLARTTDGEVLRDVVAEDSRSWVGADLPDGDTGVLFKLLDAGQRLPVHVHPDRRFAAEHLDCPYGKTEAWFVLDASADAAVYLGWREAVDPDELARRREAQDGAWMLERMHRIEVTPGDGIVVPAGTVHAIGAGVFVAEVQEPTDLSIVLEWSVTTAGREDSHLGLGFDTVMPAVSHEPLDLDRLASLRTHVDPGTRAESPLSCLATESDPFFQLHLAAPTGRSTVQVEAGFAAAIVLDGQGSLEWGTSTIGIGPGDALAMPASLGPWRIAGDARLLVARPGVGWPATLELGDAPRTTS